MSILLGAVQSRKKRPHFHEGVLADKAYLRDFLATTAAAAIATGTTARAIGALPVEGLGWGSGVIGGSIASSLISGTGSGNVSVGSSTVSTGSSGSTSSSDVVGAAEAATLIERAATAATIAAKSLLVFILNIPPNIYIFMSEFLVICLLLYQITLEITRIKFTLKLPKFVCANCNNCIKADTFFAELLQFGYNFSVNLFVCTVLLLSRR
jgi:hypothetical protein